MKLYTAMLSPFAARCRMLIHARGLAVEFVEYPHAVSKEELRALNPIGKIPILVAGDTVLPESETICEYLEDLGSGPALRPADSLDRARMRLLGRIADLYLFEPLSPLFAHLSRKRRNQEVVDAGLARIRLGLDMLERFLGDQRFAVGDALTLADCSLVPVLFFLVTYLPMLGEAEPFGRHPKTERYWAAIQTNEYAARVIGEMRQAMAEKAAQARAASAARQGSDGATT